MDPCEFSGVVMIAGWFDLFGGKNTSGFYDGFYLVISMIDTVDGRNPAPLGMYKTL